MRALRSKMKAARARVTDDVAVAFALGFVAALAFALAVDAMTPAAQSYRPPFAVSVIEIAAGSA